MIAGHAAPRTGNGSGLFFCGAIGDQSPATCANLRAASCRTWRARQRSYCNRMFIHSSGEVPRADTRRRAMAAEIPDLPFSTRERVTRVTRRCAAARDTAVSPRYSRSTRPGCGGCAYAWINSLMIILIIDENRVLAFKRERQTPIFANADRPTTFERTG